MKSLFLAALLAPALLLGAAAPAAAQRSGVYEVTGTNLDGSTYRGLMEMRQVGHSSFHILWNIGGETIEGVGMVSGLTFTTAFSAGERTGLGIYEIRPGDVMAGSWTIVGAPVNGTETVRPATETPPPGITPGVTPGTQAPAPAPGGSTLPPPRN
jgi:hypothetical protein